jgi:hypothetical protein
VVSGKEKRKVEEEEQGRREWDRVKCFFYKREGPEPAR